MKKVYLTLYGKNELDDLRSWFTVDCHLFRLSARRTRRTSICRSQIFTLVAARNRVQGLDIADNQQNDALLAVCYRALSILIEKYGTEFHENRTASVTPRLVIYSAFSQPDTRPHSSLFHLLFLGGDERVRFVCFYFLLFLFSRTWLISLNQIRKRKRTRRTSGWSV